MKGKDISYQLKVYSDYDSKFEKNVTSEARKIYILDIETKSKSGIDMARIIRRHDVESIIIFVTGHEELAQLVLKRNIMFLAFINKFDQLSELLPEAIEDALNYLRTPQVLKLEENNTMYNIKLSNILYCTKDSYERKTIIITDNNEYRVKMPLYELKEKLGDNFIQTHRSCFINKSRVEKIDWRKRLVIFDTGITTDLISVRYKR